MTHEEPAEARRVACQYCGAEACLATDQLGAAPPPICEKCGRPIREADPGKTDE